MRRLAILMLLLVTAACSRQGMMDRLASPDEQRQAIAIADQLRAGQTEALMAQAEPQLAPQLPTYVAKARPMIAGVPGSFTIHALNSVRTLGTGVAKTFTMQAGGGNRWVVVTVVLDGTISANHLYAVNVTPAPVDPAAINNFQLGKWGAFGVSWIAIMLLAVAASLAGMILPWIGRRLRRPWAWTIGSFFSLFSFTLDWGNGHVLFAPLTLIFVGARTMRPGDYAPWFLSFGLPVVAVIVIVRWLRAGRAAG